MTWRNEFYFDRMKDGSFGIYTSPPSDTRRYYLSACGTGKVAAKTFAQTAITSVPSSTDLRCEKFYLEGVAAVPGSYGIYTASGAKKYYLSQGCNGKAPNNYISAREFGARQTLLPPPIRLCLPVLA